MPRGHVAIQGFNTPMADRQLPRCLTVSATTWALDGLMVCMRLGTANNDDNNEEQDRYKKTKVLSYNNRKINSRRYSF